MRKTSPRLVKGVRKPCPHPIRRFSNYSKTHLAHSVSLLPVHGPCIRSAYVWHFTLFSRSLQVQNNSFQLQLLAFKLRRHCMYIGTTQNPLQCLKSIIHLGNKVSFNSRVCHDEDIYRGATIRSTAWADG